MLNDVERAREALNAIPADCDRSTWIKLGMAFNEAGGSFEDFHDWSQQGSNYKGRKDVLTMWESIEPSGGITRRTLFKVAAEHGHHLPRDSAPRVAKRSAERSESPVATRPTLGVTNVWDRCGAAPEAHPYIVAKHGRAEGLRVVPPNDPLTIRGERIAGWLVVPVSSLSGKIVSLQFIAPPDISNALKARSVPNKLNLPGAPMAGVFIVGELEPGGVVYLVEGIGTAWACWKATGHPAAVCFGWSLVKARAAELRERDPSAALVIVPDVGKEAEATNIAREVRGILAPMPEGWPKNADICDLALRDGFDAAEEVLANAKEPPALEPRYKLLSSTDLKSLPPLSWRIKGLLPTEGLASIYGPPACGKSFLALDMAAYIASGREWFGLKVKRAPVVYCMLEGEAGLPARVTAWEYHHNENIEASMVIQAFKLTEPHDIQALASAVLSAGSGAAVIIDTLNRAAPTADENTSKDMGSIIEAAKELQRATGGLVVLVHHTGKDASKGLRGHSSLFAALDAAIEVTRSGDRHQWILAKSKDGADGAASAFMLQTVFLGNDADGERQSSCVVTRDASGSEFRRAKVPQGRNQRIAHERLKLLFKDGVMGKPGAPPYRRCVELEAAIVSVASGLTCPVERRNERAREAITGLVAHGLLVCHDGWLWATA